MVSKMSEPSPKIQLAYSLVRLFPPLFRASALEDADFRRETGLNLQASVRLNQSGVTFDRETLYAAIEAVLSSEGETRSIEAADKTKWLISKDVSGNLVALAGGDALSLPDFDCLSPTPAVRLEWFERQAKAFCIDSGSFEKWRSVLAVRRCDDEEVEELRNEFRLTPRWFARALLEGAEGEADAPIASLVPSDSRYYYRLVGFPIEGDLSSYVSSVLSSHIDRQVAEEGVNGVAFSLLLSAHSSIPQEIRLNGISSDQVVQLLEWLGAHGDRISQLGSIELGLACLDDYPELEPAITKMTRMFIEDDDGEHGRLAQLAGLVVLVDGELARTGILRAHPPYWRRLAAIAHASLLERELLRRGANISDFSSWAYPNRSQYYFLQNSVDLRMEPRWLPEFLSPDQLKAEFVGRIFAAMIVNRDKIRSSELQSLALEKAGPLQSLIVFPAPYLPGPLEGGVEAVQPMPPDVEQQVYTDLKADVVTPKSFLGLVNTALIFKLGPQMADLAAEALRRAKYQLRGVGVDVPALSLLYGLAIVAAVTRSDGLAAEVRVLVRVVRRRPGVVMELSDALRIVMMAAAAHVDIDRWCIFVGDWLTELAYEDMTRSEARALSSRIRALCQIERRLWGTCARADAACASLSAA
jgi:hypothetical protein